MSVSTAVRGTPAPAKESRRTWGPMRMILGPVEGKIGAAILLVFTIGIVIGPWVAPYSPTALGVGSPSANPTAAHLLGTDELGRDVLSRLLTGGRSIVVVPIVATLCAFIVGGGLGMFAGYTEGRIDAVVTRVTDVLLAVPPLLMVLVIIATFGSSASVLIVSVMLVYIPQITRVMRGATQAVSRRDYVLAAQARGEPGMSVIGREILPTIAAPVLVEFALRLTWVIIFVATLTFLGLGVQPPSSNWALMVSESRTIITLAPLAALAPALAIGVLSVGVNMVADAVIQTSGGQRLREFVR